MFAQEGAGTITGHVTDPTGAAVPNAQVAAVNAATQGRTSATTNSAGIYVLPNLIPGTYSVEASANNCKKAIRPNVLVQVSDNIGLDLSLEVGSFKESVVVTTCLVVFQAIVLAVLVLQKVTHPQVVVGESGFAVVLPRAYKNFPGGRGVLLSQVEAILIEVQKRWLPGLPLKQRANVRRMIVYGQKNLARIVLERKALHLRVKRLVLKNVRVGDSRQIPA